MFNKGMLYAMYSQSALLRILDLQRSGQVVEAIRSNDKPLTEWIGSVLNQSNVGDHIQAIVTHHPKALGTDIDWQKVKDLGAVGHYDTEIAKTPVKLGDYITDEWPKAIKGPPIEMLCGEKINTFIRELA